MEASALSSSVSLVQAVGTNKFYIIIKSSLRRNVEVVRIDRFSGALKFSFTVGRDIFPTEAAALDNLKREGNVEVVGTGKHILGYIVIGSTGLLLLAEKVRVSATLPGHHEVKTVAASKWHRIPLQQPETEPPSNMARDEQAKGIDKITTFPIDGAHYFCETLDITRPFPSDRPVNQPSWEFVWNRWLSTSWRSIGLDFVCPPLLQGLLEARALDDFDGLRYHVALVSRRGRLHVGPRYKARGLNELAEPGNEIECEQIIWRVPPGKHLRTGPVAWSRYTWRRGSVPLWWGVSIKNQGIGEAEIKIKNNNTFRGSRRYARRLQKRYMPNPHLDPDDSMLPKGQGDPSLQVPLVFVSLLRKGTPDKDRSETKLASAFDFVVGALRKEHRLPLTYIALDWHEMDKVLGHEGIVEAFWSQVKDVLPTHGFALGTITKIGPDHTDPNALPSDDGRSHPPPAAPKERCLSMAGMGWQVRWFRQQRGIVRYNCADSLDRTNVGSFFGAVQVFVEQCRELDIAIAVTPKGAANIAAMIRKHLPGAGLGNGANFARGSAGSDGAGGENAKSSGLGTSFSTLEKFGKELNRSLHTIMQDLKAPKSGNPQQQQQQQSARDLSTISAPANGTPQQLQQLHFQQQIQYMEDTCGPLPAGWEAKIDRNTNRIFYVDHNTKTTSWDRPRTPVTPLATPSTPLMAVQSTPAERQPRVTFDSAVSTPQSSLVGMHSAPTGPDRLRVDTSLAEKDMWEPLSPWCMLRSPGVKRFGKRISPEALSALAELFLVNGDMSAWLYTGSQAMHSERILIFEPMDSKLRKAGVGAYGGILVGIKRRYNNVLVDSDKQMQIEMFLGMKQSAYFASTYLYYKEDTSIPMDFPESDDERDVVAQIDWPQGDKSHHAGYAYSGSSASRPGPTTDGSQHGSSSSRNRGKSFSSQELFQEFHRSQLLQRQQQEERSVMHKTVSEGSLPQHADSTSDKDSDNSSQTSGTVATPVESPYASAALARSMSAENLRMAAEAAAVEGASGMPSASAPGSGSATPERLSTASGGTAGKGPSSGFGNLGGAIKSGFKKVTDPLGALL